MILGTALGLTGMLLYYRFFHPAGPIKPFIGESVDFSIDPDIKQSPDFVIHDARYQFQVSLETFHIFTSFLVLELK